MDFIESVKVFATGLLNGKWNIIEIIGAGSFGSIYAATDIVSGVEVAVKCQKKGNSSHLRNEQHVYLKLQSENEPSVGIPKIYHCGSTLRYNYIVMEKLGPSLAYILSNKESTCEEKCFSSPTVLSVGLQILNRLESLHNKGILHLDLKPDNLLIGCTKNSKGTIYLVDFGTARIFKESRAGFFYLTDVKNPFTGSVGFSSQYRQNLLPASYRDDLESFLYCLYYLRNGSLPWLGTSPYSCSVERASIVSNLKRNMQDYELSVGFPSSMLQIVQYIRSLGFTEKPQYSYIRQLLYNCLREFGMIESPHYVKMDWI